MEGLKSLLLGLQKDVAMSVFMRVCGFFVRVTMGLLRRLCNRL